MIAIGLITMVFLVVYWMAGELLAMAFGQIVRRLRLYPVVFIVFWVEAWKQGWDVLQSTILAGWKAKWWVLQKEMLPHPWGVRIARWFL